MPRHHFSHVYSSYSTPNLLKAMTMPAVPTVVKGKELGGMEELEVEVGEIQLWAEGLLVKGSPGQ